MRSNYDARAKLVLGNTTPQQLASGGTHRKSSAKSLVASERHKFIPANEFNEYEVMCLKATCNPTGTFSPRSSHATGFH